MNYYELLEITIKASDNEIKKSYRKLAMKWHPDRNNNSKEAEEKFKEIKTAYETLSNKSSRFWYNRDLEEKNKKSQSSYTSNSNFNNYKQDSQQKERHHQNQNNQSSSFNSTNESKDKTSSSSEKNAQWQDTHSYDRANKSQGNTADSQQQNDFSSSNYNSFTDNDNNSKQKNFSENNINNKQWKTKYPYSNIYHYIFNLNADDSITGGNFSFVFDIPGRGAITINLTVPPYTTVSEPIDLVLTPEDVLIVSLNILKSESEGLDIHSSIDIDIFSALLGFTTKISTSAGVKSIKIPALTKDGDVLSYYGFGRKKHIFNGNLYIKVHVKYPSKLDEEQKEFLSKLSNIQIKKERSFFSKFFKR